MATTAGKVRDERSTSRLVHDLSEQSSRLVRQEISLARSELTHKGVEARLGIGLLAGAGILSLYGLAALTAGGILLLSTAMKAWLAAVVIAAGVLLVAAAAAMIAKAHLRGVVPPVPEATIKTTKQDVATVRASIRKGRS